MTSQPTSAAQGYIYVLSSPSMGPDFYKVGCTTKHPLIRAKELSAPSGLPCAFVLVYHRYIEFPFHAESVLHRMFDRYRVNENREFFLMPLHLIIQEIDKLTGLVEPASDQVGDELDAQLPWSWLFSSFRDDNSPRELTQNERDLCADLAYRLRTGEVIH